jgi:hypothetical protein
MTGTGRNLAASVAARLLNRAKQTGDDYQTLLTAYCFERFLYRLGRSEVRDRFILVDLLATFLLPILDDVRRGARAQGTWPKGGPWR